MMINSGRPRRMGMHAALAAAALLGLGGALPVTGISVKPTTRPDPPRIEAPAHAIKTSRQNRKIAERQRRKARRRAESIARHRHGEKRRKLFFQKQNSGDLHAAINRLTNWQRKHWARAGYPADIDRINAFAKMVRA